MIYANFSRVFGRLNHAILLRKPEESSLFLPLLSLLKSYLADENQCVECRRFVSSEITVTSGVPQGSILGPLIFIALVNYILSVLDVFHLLYAEAITFL